MASNKRSARARQRMEFESGFSGTGLADLFDREHVREERIDAEHEAALRNKACGSKNRYASRMEAEAAKNSCAAHGRGGLSIYRCPYCDGWHLTSHPRDRRTR